MADKPSYSYSLPANGSPPTVQSEWQSFDLFPTRIWQAQYKQLGARLSAWTEAALALRAAHPKPAGRTNRQGSDPWSCQRRRTQWPGDVELKPSAGLLVLFPCWMEHYVEPHDSDEPRISLSFNAVSTRAAAPEVADAQALELPPAVL